MSSPPGPHWLRLAELLVSARIELDPRYANRRTFVRERGGVETDVGNSVVYKMVFDLEKARRTNYEPATLTLAERMYGWERGSIALVLAGGDPIRLADIETRRVEHPDDPEGVEHYVVRFRQEVGQLPTEDPEVRAILDHHIELIRAWRKSRHDPEDSGE